MLNGFAGQGGQLALARNRGCVWVAPWNEDRDCKVVSRLGIDREPADQESNQVPTNAKELKEFADPHCTAWHMKSLRRNPDATTKVQKSRFDSLCRRGDPRASAGCEFSLNERPVVKCGRVEVGAVGPDERVHFGVKAHVAKQLRIL